MEPEPKLDVFLSHASVDKPVVEDLARILKRRGIEPWLDSWNLVPGEPWQEAIEEALGRCAACAVIIGPNGSGPWQNEEMRAAIERQVGLKGGRVIPVLLPNAERGERSRLPAFLARRTWVKFHESLEDERALHRLISGIRGKQPGPAPGEAVAEGVCPYRGLRFFDVEDGLFFHGREALTGWLLAKLQPTRRDPRFLAIVGPSGSGKSSLARAGLLAALKNGEALGSQDWPRVACKPGEQPLENLAIALTQALRPNDPPAAVSQLARSFGADSHTLHITTSLALREAPERHLVLLIDQFEELFALCQDEAHRQALIANLVYAAREPTGQTAVILTLRADFLGRCAAYPELAELLSDRIELVGPMAEEELRDAIERPARLSGLELEGGLADLLMGEVKSQTGGLPLLQHALLRIWELRVGRKLTLAAYREIGGVAGALQGHAEKVFASFTEAERKACPRVLLRLVQVDDQQRVMKRRLSIDEVIRGGGGDRKTIETIVSRFTDERLLTAGDPKRPTVELAHEALFTAWKRLADWIQNDQQDLQTRDRIEEASREWAANKREPSYLYSGARLSQAQDWAARHSGDLSPDAQAFVKDGVARRENEQAKTSRQRRWLTISLAALALVAVLVAAQMYDLWQGALQQQKTNLALQMATKARSSLSTNPLISLLLASESVHLQNNLPMAKEALLGALALVGGRSLGMPGIVAIASSEDHRTLVTANQEGTVAIWDLDLWNPQTIRTLTVKGKIDHRGLALSNDRRWLLVNDLDEVRLWDLKKGGHGIVLPDEHWLHGDPFSPDSRWLVTQRFDTPVLRRLGSEPLLKVLEKGPPLRDMAFGPDSRLGVVLSDPLKMNEVAILEIWDLNQVWDSKNQGNGSGRTSLPDFTSFTNQGIMLTEPKAKIETASSDRKLLAGALEEEAFHPMTQPQATLEATTSDRKWLARAEEVGAVHLKNSVYTYQTYPDSKFSPLGQPIRSMFFVRKDNQLVTHAGAEAPRLWALNSYSSEEVLAATPEGTRRAVRVSRGAVAVFDGKTRRQLQSFDLLPSVWTFSPDGLRLAAGSFDGQVFVWNLTTSNMAPQVATLKVSIDRLAFDPKGQLLAIGGQGTVWSWDLHMKEPALIIRDTSREPISALAFGSEPARLAIGCDKGKVLLFDLASSRLRKMLRRETAVTALAFSPDGKRFALAEASGKAHIWSDESAGTPIEIQGRSARILEFSKDGRSLASGGEDGTLQIWDLGEDIVSISWTGHDNPIRALAFTADGQELVTTGSTDAVRRWPLDTEELIRVACARAGAGRNLTKEEWDRYAPAGASFREGAPCKGVGPPRSGLVY